MNWLLRLTAESVRTKNTYGKAKKQKTGIISKSNYLKKNCPCAALFLRKTGVGNKHCWDHTVIK